MKTNTFLVGFGNYDTYTKVKFYDILKLNEDDSFLKFLSVAFLIQHELLDTKVLDFSRLSIDDLIVESFCRGYIKFARYLSSIKSAKKYGFITIVKNDTVINRSEQALLILEMLNQGTFDYVKEEENILLSSSSKFLNKTELTLLNIINIDCKKTMLTLR